MDPRDTGHRAARREMARLRMAGHRHRRPRLFSDIKSLRGSEGDDGKTELDLGQDGQREGGLFHGEQYRVPLHGPDRRSAPGRFKGIGRMKTDVSAKPATGGAMPSGTWFEGERKP